MDYTKMRISEHINELRSRLLFSMLFFVLTFCFCYYFSEEIYNFLLQPLLTLEEGQADFSLIYTAMTEAFFVYLKVAFMAAFLITFPIFAWQIYSFIAPGLYKAEKRLLVPYLIATPLLFATGMAVVYYYVFPLAWKFFISFEKLDSASKVEIEFMPSVSEYLDLVVQLMFAFGAAFQMPVVLTLLARVGIINAEYLVRKRRLAIIVIFIVAAILTPPDVLSQVGLAVPMIILYEASILACKLMCDKNERKKEEKQAQ